MSKDYSIQLFEEKNLDEVVKINWTCLPENYDNSFFLDVHKNFPKTFVVATAENKVVGYIMCRIEIGFSELKRLKIGKKGHVISLAVLSQYRGQGIASALLSKALKNMSEYISDECYLEVRVSNKIAITLYESLNFKIVRTIHGYYRDGEDANIMSKVLT